MNAVKKMLQARRKQKLSVSTFMPFRALPAPHASVCALDYIVYVARSLIQMYNFLGEALDYSASLRSRHAHSLLKV